MPEWKSLPPEIQKYIIATVEKVARDYLTRHEVQLKIAIGLGLVTLIALLIFGFIVWGKIRRLSAEQKKLEGEVKLNEIAARSAELKFLTDVQEAKELSSKYERELEAIILEMMAEMDKKNSKSNVKGLREKGLDIFVREYSSSYAHYVEVKSLQVAGKSEAARGFINSSIIPWLGAAASFLETFNHQNVLGPIKVAPYLLSPYYFSDITGFLDAHLDPSWADESKRITAIRTRLNKWVRP